MRRQGMQLYTQAWLQDQAFLPTGHGNHLETLRYAPLSKLAMFLQLHHYLCVKYTSISNVFFPNN